MRLLKPGQLNSLCKGKQIWIDGRSKDRRGRVVEVQFGNIRLMVLIVRRGRGEYGEKISLVQSVD